MQPPEHKTIEGLSERIIPRTDTPGAKDAGVALLIGKDIAWRPGHRFESSTSQTSAKNR